MIQELNNLMLLNRNNGMIFKLYTIPQNFQYKPFNLFMCVDDEALFTFCLHHSYQIKIHSFQQGHELSQYLSDTLLCMFILSLSVAVNVGITDWFWT